MKYFVLMVLLSLGAFAQDDCEQAGELFYVAITESSDEVVKMHNVVGAAGCPTVVADGTILGVGDLDNESFISGNRYLLFFTGLDGHYQLRLTLIQSLLDKSPYPVSDIDSVDLHKVKKTTFSQDFKLAGDNTGVFDFALNGWEYNLVVKGMGD